MGFGTDVGSVKQLPRRDDFVKFTGMVAAFHHSVLLVVVNRVSVLCVQSHD